MMVLEKSGAVGGIARTVRYKNYRIDIGGHRFRSRDPKIIRWWTDLLPVQAESECEKEDRVFLLRRRASHIFYQGKYYEYPVTASLQTFANMGLVQSAEAVGSSSRKD